MEVTFGAVGDFISIAVLIKDLIDLLDDSRGSAWEYQSLREQLSFLEQNLHRAKDQYNELRNVAEFSDICDGLETVVDEAERRLEEIAVKIKKYTSTLTEGSTKRTIKKVARKVQWSLEKKETEKFLIDLNRYVGIIQSLQFDAFRRLMQRNFNNSQNIQTDTQALIRQLQNDFTNRMTTLEDELRAVRSTSSNTQQYLLAVGVVVSQRLDNVTQAVNTLGVIALQGASGVRWLGTSVLGLLATMHTSIMGRLERPPHLGPFFMFEDYMGVETIILLDFIDSWSAFEGSINGKFKGKKGGRRVAKNRFLLQDRKTGQELHREMHWSLAIVPGSRINMSLVCEVEEDEDEAASLRCPFCKATCEGVIGTFIECPSCQQVFRKLQGLADDEAVPFAPDAPDTTTCATKRGAGNTSSDISHSSKRKESPYERIRAKKPRQTTRDSHSGSDSDDTDLAGIKRVAVLPILRLSPRPAAKKPELEKLFGPSEQQLLRDQASSDKSRGSAEINEPNGRQWVYDEPWPEGEIIEVNGKTFLVQAPSKKDRATRNKADYVPHYYNVYNPAAAPGSSSPSRAGGLRRSPASPTSRDTAFYYYTPGTKSTGSKAHPYYYTSSEQSGIKQNPESGNAYGNAHRYQPNSHDYVSQNATLQEYARRHGRRSVTPLSSRPSQARKARKPNVAVQAPPQATEADAGKHRIPNGYSLKHWDPTEEPIVLLGSVFDANSLGKWIYDWTVFFHGQATPISDMAGDLWLLLIQLYGKTKRAEEVGPRIRNLELREIAEDFIKAGERLADKLHKLLRTCEAPMLKTANIWAHQQLETKKQEVSNTPSDDTNKETATEEKDDVPKERRSNKSNEETAGSKFPGGTTSRESKQLPSGLGIPAAQEFINTIFGRDRELPRTEKFMQGIRLWILRFDANLEEVLRNPSI